MHAIERLDERVKIFRLDRIRRRRGWDRRDRSDGGNDTEGRSGGAVTTRDRRELVGETVRHGSSTVEDPRNSVVDVLDLVRLVRGMMGLRDVKTVAGGAGDILGKGLEDSATLLVLGEQVASAEILGDRKVLAIEARPLREIGDTVGGRLSD